jgi:CubicO group peptidase (beta-lactamase class C family)
MKEIMSYKTMHNCRKFSLLLSFVLLCLVGKTQYNFAEFDKLLSANQKALGNDVVALVYKDGKMVYQKTLGEFNLRSKAPIASCSKWLTAALVMTFVDEGKISLDDKVGKYLPVFDTYRKENITIRHCLTHLTGIEDNTTAVTRLFERHKYPSLDKEVISFAQRGVSAQPGAAFIYGNIGLDIAARVLEVISDKKFDVLIKQRLFTPLNMRNSSFTPEDETPDPSNGGISAPADYMNFLEMLLDKGMFMGKRVLSEAAVAEMLTIQTKNSAKKYAPKVAEGFEYGLGAWIGQPGENGNGNVISCPSLTGTLAFVDKCRNYACLIFTKGSSGEQKDLLLQLKKEIEKQIPGACK